MFLSPPFFPLHFYHTCSFFEFRELNLAEVDTGSQSSRGNPLIMDIYNNFTTCMSAFQHETQVHIQAINNCFKDSRWKIHSYIRNKLCNFSLDMGKFTSYLNVLIFFSEFAESGARLFL